MLFDPLVIYTMPRITSVFVLYIYIYIFVPKVLVCPRLYCIINVCSFREAVWLITLFEIFQDYLVPVAAYFLVALSYVYILYPARAVHGVLCCIIFSELIF